MGLIRFFLAISVVISHNGIRVPGIEGALAVMAFFVISGFYMALVLNEKYQNNTMGFYVARYLRLWPSYIIVFSIVTLFVTPMETQIYENVSAAIFVWLSSISLLFTQLLWWFGLDASGHIVFMSKEMEGSGVKLLTNAAHMQHMWSVGVEICFYLVAPLFARKLKVIIPLFILSAILYVVIKYTTIYHNPFNYRSAISSFWLFLAGMLAYFGWSKFRLKIESCNLNPILLSITGLFVTILCIAISWHYFESPLVIIGSFIVFAISIIPIFEATKLCKWDKVIGELSYPIYLTHWPIVAFMITDHRGSWLWSFIMIAESIVCAAILHFCVETHIEKYRRKFANRKPYPQSASQSDN